MLILITIVVGASIRFSKLGLSFSVVKYGGSMLWSLLIYLIITAVRPSWRIVSAAILSGSIATAVELFKLYRSPELDAFRHTLPGILLLGHVFSAWDILAYWMAITAGACLDMLLRRQFHQSAY